MGNLLPMLIFLLGGKVLAEIPVVIIQYAVLIRTVTHKPMVRRPRPIFNSLCQPMLDRIIMNIIDVPVQIILVAYLMFPETPLPDAAFSLFLSGQTLPGFMPSRLEISTGESLLD